MHLILQQLKEYTPLEHIDRQYIIQATSTIEKVYNDIQQVKKGDSNSTADMLRIRDILKGFPEVRIRVPK